MQLTKNFWLHEFHCKDGTKVPKEFIPNVHRLADNLQVYRDWLNENRGDRPEYIISVISGWRSYWYNIRVGGALKSYHKKGLASDIVVPGRTPDQVAEDISMLIRLGKMEQGGLGRYNTFTHYDCRGYQARWDNRK